MTCCAKSRRRSSERNHRSSNSARMIGAHTSAMSAKTICAVESAARIVTLTAERTNPTIDKTTGVASGAEMIVRMTAIVAGTNVKMTATMGEIRATKSDASGRVKTGLVSGSES